ncbi:MAG: DciA family protein [Wenzhouxiangellaceae bacterium]
MNAGKSSPDPAGRDGAGARRVDAIAGDRGGPGRALRQAQAFLALNARLRERIPENARGRIAVACIEGDCLVIAAASSARASQARLLADSLLEAAQRHWPGKLARTRVIVAPGLNMEA